MLSLVVLNGCMERQLLNTEELLEGAAAGGRQERKAGRQANEQVSEQAAAEDFYGRRF